MPCRDAITLSRIAVLTLSEAASVPTVEGMRLDRLPRPLVAWAVAGVFAASLIPLSPASAAPVGADSRPHVTEPASKKKKGPPPGATTKQIQGWINDALKEQYSSCSQTGSWPCTLTIDWSSIRWLGTARECVEGGNYGRPCLKYGTAYVARTSIMVTTVTQESDGFRTDKTQLGYWDGGRDIVQYEQWPGWTSSAKCSLGCGSDIRVRKGKFGRWFWGFDNTVYILR